MNSYVHKVMHTTMLTIVLTLVGCTSSTSSVDLTGKAAPSPPVVHMWLTTLDRQDKLTAQTPIALQSGQASPASGTLITVDPTQHFQRITGFGAALTDTSAYVLSRLSPDQQQVAMRALFDPQQGIGLSQVRIPMGSSDYTATPPDHPTPYSYDDLAPGKADPSLTHFLIAHDKAYILPLLLQAKRINPQITTIAAPWSPPAWMKTIDSMVNGSVRDDSYGILAQYFVHFLQQYHSAGVSIDAITPQNEPGEINHGFPSIMEVVNNYDIDAVHMDDYFYPYPIAGQDFPDNATYQQYGAGKFANKGDWRRDNVNQLVHELATDIKQAKSYVKFGISPFGVWRNKATDPTDSDTTAGVQDYDDLYADTRTWIKNNWLDYIAPQIYWNIGFPPAAYEKLVNWWSKEVAGSNVHLYIGEAAYKIHANNAAWDNPEEIPNHFKLDLQYSAVKGNIFFSLKDLLKNPLGIKDRLSKDIYKDKALVPVMPWLGERSPCSVEGQNESIRNQF